MSATVLELAVVEGLLRFDGTVVELFRSDGRTGAWRLHAALITAIEQDRRKDRIEVRFRTTPTFYESAQVPLTDESMARELVRAVEAAGA